MVREKIREGLDKAANWIRDNKEIAVAGGIVGAAVIKTVLKRALKPTIIYQVVLKKED